MLSEYQLMIAGLYGIPTSTVKKLGPNLLKWTSKPSYMSQKIFDNDIVAIRKSKSHINT